MVSLEGVGEGGGQGLGQGGGEKKSESLSVSRGRSMLLGQGAEGVQMESPTLDPGEYKIHW